MTFKQTIPLSWMGSVRRQPGCRNIYNLDDAVGLHCANKRLDVMLLHWAVKSEYLQLADPRPKGQITNKLWLDMASDPSVPGDLSVALKTLKTAA